MIPIVGIIGIGIVILTLLTMAYKTEDNHWPFKIFCLFYCLLLLLLVAFFITEDSTKICDVVLTNYTMTDNATAMTQSSFHYEHQWNSYGLQCFDRGNKAPDTLLWALIIFIVLSLFYWLLAILGYGVFDVLDKIRNRGR